MIFKDREDAAKQLLPELKKYRGNKEVVILAIPRGALQMGVILREALELPLDIVVTKKIGAPGNEEFAIGAVDPEGNMSLNETVMAGYGIPKSYAEDEAKRLQHVIRRRYEDYRGNPTPPHLKGKIVVLVDDGIATGFTTQAAVSYIHRQQPKKIILAVPVASLEAAEKLKKEVDEWVCLDTPEDFYAVAQFYQNFPQVTDEEAIQLLGLRQRSDK